MGILKKILFAILGIIALAILVAAFLPKNFEYERSIDINASKEVVFSIVNDLKTQDVWGPWQKQDPTIKNIYNEVASGVGQVSSWTSEGSGNGKQTITESTPPTSVKVKVEFEGQGGGDGWYKLADGENGATKTSWGMAFDAPWPTNIFTALFAGSMMNKMFDTGLTDLKKMAEAQAAAAPAATGSFEVKETNFPGATYLGIRQEASFDEAMKQSFFSERIGKVMGLMEKAKLQGAGSPTSVYFLWDEATKKTDMAVAMPIAKGTAIAGDPSIKVFDVPANKALVVDYYGAYEGIGKAHEALTAYVKEKGLKEIAPVLEEYLTDPEVEKDQSKWLTKIYYFVESPK
ncbi:MAG: SRPBCC family protein [Saprospiraceae bacterium]|nr:SRPBCC family protein [Saprospiraceae bacterium]